jgi:hypothetical protein
VVSHRNSLRGASGALIAKSAPKGNGRIAAAQRERVSSPAHFFPIVLACSAEGYEREVAMPCKWIGPLTIVTVLTMAGAKAGEAGRLSMGGLSRPDEGGRWTVRNDGQSYAIGCSFDRCEETDLIGLTIANGTGASCSNDLLLARAGAAALDGGGADVLPAQPLVRPGFELKVVTVDLGCRNWAGSPVFACTSIANDLYLFTAHPGGCQSSGLFDQLVFEFLSGLALQ